MPVNYAEVLKDMDDRESALMTELAQLKAARPLMIAFKRQQDATAILSSPQGRFVGVGPTRAIPELLKNQDDLMSVDEIVEGLKQEGWTTKSSEPATVISSTLAQLKEIVERVGDRYRLKEGRKQQDQITISLPAPGSFAAQDANGRLRPS